jgi:hypothetical protein
LHPGLHRVRLTSHARMDIIGRPSQRSRKGSRPHQSKQLGLQQTEHISRSADVSIQKIRPASTGGTAQDVSGSLPEGPRAEGVHDLEKSCVEAAVTAGAQLAGAELIDWNHRRSPLEYYPESLHRHRAMTTDTFSVAPFSISDQNMSAYYGDDPRGQRVECLQLIRLQKKRHLRKAFPAQKVIR